MDLTLHEKLRNIIFGHCTDFDLIQSFWNVITASLANGELVSGCWSQTSKQALHVGDWCGCTWVGVFGSGSDRPPLFFRLHLWRLDTVAPQRGRAKCLKTSVHTCVSSPSAPASRYCLGLLCSGVDVLLTSSTEAVGGRWPVVFPAIPRSLNLPGAPLSSDLIATLGFESKQLWKTVS